MRPRFSSGWGSDDQARLRALHPLVGAHRLRGARRHLDGSLHHGAAAHRDLARARLRGAPRRARQSAPRHREPREAARHGRARRRSHRLADDRRAARGRRMRRAPRCRSASPRSRAWICASSRSRMAARMTARVFSGRSRPPSATCRASASPASSPSPTASFTTFPPIRRRSASADPFHALDHRPSGRARPAHRARRGAALRPRQQGRHHQGARARSRLQRSGAGHRQRRRPAPFVERGEARRRFSRSRCRSRMRAASWSRSMPRPPRTS